MKILSGPETQTWNGYLKKETQLTAAAAAGIAPGIYRVAVRFIIDWEGNLADVKAKNNPGFGLAKRQRILFSITIEYGIRLSNAAEM